MTASTLRSALSHALRSTCLSSRQRSILAYAVENMTDKELMTLYQLGQFDSAIRQCKVLREALQLTSKKKSELQDNAFRRSRWFGKLFKIRYSHLRSDRYEVRPTPRVSVKYLIGLSKRQGVHIAMDEAENIVQSNDSKIRGNASGYFVVTDTDKGFFRDVIVILPAWYLPMYAAQALVGNPAVNLYNVFVNADTDAEAGHPNLAPNRYDATYFPAYIIADVAITDEAGVMAFVADDGISSDKITAAARNVLRRNGYKSANRRAAELGYELPKLAVIRLRFSIEMANALRHGDIADYFEAPIWLCPAHHIINHYPVEFPLDYKKRLLLKQTQKYVAAKVLRKRFAAVEALLTDVANAEYYAAVNIEAVTTTGDVDIVPQTVLAPAMRKTLHQLMNTPREHLTADSFTDIATALFNSGFSPSTGHIYAFRLSNGNYTVLIKRSANGYRVYIRVSKTYRYRRPAKTRTSHTTRTKTASTKRIGYQFSKLPKKIRELGPNIRLLDGIPEGYTIDAAAMEKWSQKGFIPYSNGQDTVLVYITAKKKYYIRVEAAQREG